MLKEFHNNNVTEDFLEGFHLMKYGYTFEARLNAKDAWDRKVVCSVLKHGAQRQVSTTFPNVERYLKFLGVSSLLKESERLHPEVIQVYEEERTAVCSYIGEFLPPFLLGDRVYSAIDAVLRCLVLPNAISQKEQVFEIPRMLDSFFKLSDNFPQMLPLISGTKNILPQLKEKGICFKYGSGIEDPDIKNFRVIKDNGQLQAFTTDYDCWGDRVNYFWAVGYFYASLRWVAKVSLGASRKCSDYILYTVDMGEKKREFMFWLGVLSGYCGYAKTLEKAIAGDRMSVFQDRLQLVKELDEKTSRLGNRLIETE